MNHSITVPFYGSNLVSIKVEDVAYVAMRPIVEAIGLDWGSQSVKIRNNKEKLGCCDIATPSNGGMQSMVCIPIRKLNGWLFSINPAKVKESIRNKVIQYQEECFEALHDYWTKGIAVHPNFRAEKTRKALPNGLTIDQQDTIKTYHKTLVARLPKEKQAKLAITLWSAIKSKYGVSYKEVPPEEFTGVVSLMSRVAVDYLEAEWLPETSRALVQKKGIHLTPIVMPQLNNGHNKRQEQINYISMIRMYELRNAPISILLSQLEQFDFDTGALKLEYKALKELIATYHRKFAAVAMVMDSEPSYGFLHY